jgi:hypothetical protein
VGGAAGHGGSFISGGQEQNAIYLDRYSGFRPGETAQILHEDFRSGTLNDYSSKRMLELRSMG